MLKLILCILMGLNLLGCATTSAPTTTWTADTHEQALQQVLANLQQAQAIAATLAPSVISAAAVTAEGVETISGNGNLVALTQQAAAIAANLANTIGPLTAVANKVPANAPVTVPAVSVAPYRSATAAPTVSPNQAAP